MEPLRKKIDFSKTYRNGQQVRNTDYTVKALATNTTVLKLAIVVPKKVSKKAVVRNRARRRVREIIRKNIHLAEPNYFVIVNIYTDLTNLTPEQLEESIIKSFQKLKIFKPYETSSNKNH
jgi:ribonuclease P protein component